MAVWTALLIASFAAFPAVTATSALLSSGRHDTSQPATQGNADGTPAPVAATAAPASATAAPEAMTVAASSNYVTYKPDDFYEKEFATDSNNPLEELTMSDSYPTSGPLKGTAAGASEGQATKTAPASAEASKETSKEMPAETPETESANASAVQLTQPESSEAPVATETTPAAKRANVPSAKENTSPQSTCVTRTDSRVAAWFKETANEGSACMFGVDSRDEGSHCILEGGKYGSNGWCYTAKDASTWGSCAAGCPLHGSAAAVAAKIDVLADAVGLLKSRVAAAKAAQSTSVAQVTAGTKANLTLLQPNGTLLQRGRNSENGPIEWIRSWFASSDLNESAQIAVSTGKDSANTTKRGQVVAVPLQSQLLQKSRRSVPPVNSSAMEISKQNQSTGSNVVSGVVTVKLQSQLLQKHGAPKSKVKSKEKSKEQSKETGAVVAVKLQSQFLQKKSAPSSKTSFMHAHRRKKAAKKGKSNGNKTKKGVVVVKLNSQL